MLLDDWGHESVATCCRKIRGKLPELTDAELRHYRSSLYGVAAVGQIPWARFGRDKYVYHHNQGPTPPSLKWTPQAREAARRALMTGTPSPIRSKSCPRLP